MTQAIWFQILFAEFFMSFVFFTAWLVIRKYDLGQFERLGAIIKPFLVFFVYQSATLFLAYGGYRNPNLAIAQVIWNAGYYN